MTNMLKRIVHVSRAAKSWQRGEVHGSVFENRKTLKESARSAVANVVADGKLPHFTHSTDSVGEHKRTSPGGALSEDAAVAVKDGGKDAKKG